MYYILKRHLSCHKLVKGDVGLFWNLSFLGPKQSPDQRPDLGYDLGSNLGFNLGSQPPDVGSNIEILVHFFNSSSCLNLQYNQAHHPSRLPLEGHDLRCPNHGGHRIHSRPAEGHQEWTTHRPNAHHAEILQMYPHHSGQRRSRRACKGKLFQFYDTYWVWETHGP